MNLEQLFEIFWKPAVFSFLLSLFLIVLALRFFPQIGLIDRPHKYGLKRKPIPYYGGLVIFASFVISVLIFVPMTMTVLGLLLGSCVIVLIGFFDDLFDVKPWWRLVFQLVATLILVVFGVGILSINLPFIGILDFSDPVWAIDLFGFKFNLMIVSVLFTIFWVLAIVNTMNLVDGIGGLSSGVTFIAALIIFLLSIHSGIHEDPMSQVGVASVALILSMSALAFLFFDFPKPKILMGDTGSTFLGFMIATLAIFSGGKVATAFLVLGIPILDMIWVILRRLFSGKSIMKGDLKHLHHRLLDSGFNDRKVVLMYLFFTAVFGFSAVLFVSSKQKFFMIIALLILMVLLAGALIMLPRRR